MDGKRQYLAVSTAAEATQIRNTRMRRSSRKGDDFIEVGTHYETIGRFLIQKEMKKHFTGQDS